MARARGTGRGTGGQLLLVALGAVAGVAIGMAIADRVGGLDGLRRRLHRRRQRRHRDEGARPEDPGQGPVAAAVEPTTRAEAHDVALEERVLEVFRNDPLLADRAIDIGAVDAHTIELAGWVHEASEIAYAVTLAGGVPGVKAVESLLALRPPRAG